VPLGRHHPGHHRYRDGDADPRSADIDRAPSRRHCGCARCAGAQISRYAYGRPQQFTAGSPDYLRLQSGNPARRVRTASQASQ
jgi:hypothetical protein